MNIADVMDDLGAALKTIPGLRVFPYTAEDLPAPAAVVEWPEEINYDATMGRGSDRMSMRVSVVAGGSSTRGARDQLAKYLDGAGSASVKAAIESYDASAYDSARVSQALPAVIESAGVQYLGAIFTVDLIGRGA